METSQAFSWYIQHPEEVQQYAGKHLAIVDDGIAAVAESAWEAYRQAKAKYPEKEPALTYVPHGDLLIL